MEKVLILGTGIAGCTAAIYTARANLHPLVISSTGGWRAIDFNYGCREFSRIS